MTARLSGLGTAALVLAALITVAGCSTAPAASTDSPSSPAGQTAAPVASGVRQPIVFGPGTFDVSETTYGLDTLTSYRARLDVSFEGTQGGVDTAWTVTSELVQQDASSRQLTTDASGAVAPAATGTAWSINGALYEQPTGGPCTRSPEAGTTPVVDPLAPASRLNAVIGAELAATETIDGIATERATFDERGLGLAGVADATGSLWTAVDDGYLVRYELTTTGGPAYFGEGVDGTATWAYRLSEMDKSLRVDVPAECAIIGGTIPGIAGAEDVVEQSGLLSYRTSESIAAVIAFYSGKAAELGWTASGETLEAEGVAVMEFTSASGKVTVLLTRIDGDTKVHVSIDPTSGARRDQVSDRRR